MNKLRLLFTVVSVFILLFVFTVMSNANVTATQGVPCSGSLDEFGDETVEFTPLKTGYYKIKDNINSGIEFGTFYDTVAGDYIDYNIPNGDNTIYLFLTSGKKYSFDMYSEAYKGYNISIDYVNPVSSFNNEKFIINETNPSIGVFSPSETGYYSFYTGNNYSIFSFYPDENDSIFFVRADYNFSVFYLEKNRDYLYTVMTDETKNQNISLSSEKTKVYPVKLDIISNPLVTDMVYGCEYSYKNSSWGLKAKVTMSDGSEHILSGEEYLYINGFPFYCDLEQEYKEDGTVKYSYFNVVCGVISKKIMINFIDTSVKKIEVVKPASKVYFENCCGEYSYDGTYFLYDYEYPKDALIKITYKDGSSVLAYSGSTVNGCSFDFDYMQDTIHWVKGINKVKVKYLGQETYMDVKVLDSVKSFEIIKPSSAKLAELTDGYLEEKDFFHYYYDDAIKDAVVTVTLNNGEKYTAHPGEYLLGSFVWSEDEQYDNPWKAGDNKITLSWNCYSADMKINVEKGTAKSVSVASQPTRKYVYGDANFGGHFYDNEKNSYFYSFYPNDFKGLKLNYVGADGKQQTFDFSDDKSTGLNKETFDYTVNSTENGKSAEVYGTFKGLLFEYKVTNAANNVSSIEIADLPDNLFVYSNYGFPDFAGTKLIINYSDKDSKTVTLDRSKFKSPSLVEIDGYGCDISVRTDEKTGQNIYYFGYLGKIAEVKDSAVTKKYVKDYSVVSLKKSVKGSEFIVTLSDGKKETIKILDSFGEKYDNGVWANVLTPLGITFLNVYPEYEKEDIAYVEFFDIVKYVKLSDYYVASKTGDTDCDDAITVEDARNALRIAVKLDNPEDSVREAADVDADGSVSVEDARLILRVAVKLDDESSFKA